MSQLNLKIIFLYLQLVFIAFGMTSCSDNNPEVEFPVKQIKLYLTDDPLDAEEVNIEIISIILKGKGTDEIELNTLSGIYNLLDYTGDLDTLIASGNYDLEEIKEIILILGDENSIKVDGQLYPLTLSNDRKEVRIKVDVNLSENTLYDLLIDFDACESIKEHNGMYSLSPVIRFKGNRNFKTIDKSDIIALADCYELQFPVMVLTSKGETKPIDDLETLLLLYADESIFGVTYPLTVVDSRGTVEIIRNGNQAEKLIKKCGQPDEGEDLAGIILKAQKCFEVKYPLNVVDLNNMVLMVNTIEELKSVPNLLDFEYPFFIYTPTSDSIAINNLNQLEAKIKNCDQGEIEGVDVKGLLDSLAVCYALEFPITIKLEDGSLVEILGIDDLVVLSGVPYAISFPIYLSKGGADRTKISNLNQVKKLIEACHESGEGMVEFDVIEYLSILENCVQIQFPITGILEDKETFQIDSLAVILELDMETIGIIFPIYFLNESGDNQPINNLSQLEAILKNCDGTEEISFEELIGLVELCHDIIYPVQVILLPDSSLLLITGEDELWEAIDDYEISVFVYPIEIVDSDGKSKRINNTPQLEAQSKKCDREEKTLLTDLSRCYEFKFPIVFLTKEQDELVANSLDELKKYWAEYADLKFSYPIFLITDSGDVKEIKNRGKLNDALKNCK